MKIQVNIISNSSEFDTYLKVVESFNIINPFYKVFGATINEDLFDELHYFTLINNNTIIIMMPFIKRKIPYQEDHQSYYDVVSPYGFSGPLYNEDMSRGYLIKFWEFVDAWYKKNFVVSEFMRFSLNDNNQFYSGFLIPTLTNVKGLLLHPEIQWKSLKQKVRNNYRKAKNYNLEARFFKYGSAEAIISDFHKIFTDTMERNVADSNYFHSLKYFKSVMKLSKENFVIVLIYKEGNPISGELILIAGDTLYSFLGGTLNEYFQFRPNDFLKVEVMKWAYSNNYQYYLLGGGRRDSDSLYKYKKTFFPNDTDTIYYTGRKIINQDMYDRLDKILNAKLQIDDIEISDQVENGLQFFPSYRKFQFKK